MCIRDREDVAQLAGVSTAVVSYVVNHGPRPVSIDAARRVREAMELLGYRPNASARALRRGRTETVGLVLGDSLNPFFTQYTFEPVSYTHLDVYKRQRPLYMLERLPVGPTGVGATPVSMPL